MKNLIPEVLFVERFQPQLSVIQRLNARCKIDYETTQSLEGAKDLSQVFFPSVVLLIAEPNDPELRLFIQELKKMDVLTDKPLIWLSPQISDVEALDVETMSLISDHWSLELHDAILTKRLELMVQLSTQQEELEAVRTQDPTTGLCTPAYFDKQVSIIWQQAIRQEQILSFSLFQPTLNGKVYAATMEELYSIGQCINHNVHRPADLASRYSEQEDLFILCFSHTDEEGAKVVSQRILHALSQLPSSQKLHWQLAQNTVKPEVGTLAEHLINQLETQLRKATSQDDYEEY